MDGQELHLTPSEYKLLCLLSKNVGKVLTHTFIAQQIWNRSWDNDIASLRVFMATLRKKLEKEPDSPQYIQTHIASDTGCCVWNKRLISAGRPINWGGRF